MTSNSVRSRALRAAAVGVTLAATAASGAFFTASAHADDRWGAPAADRQDPTSPAKEQVKHDLEGPYSRQQAQAREAALDQVLTGKKDVEQRGASKVVKLDDKKYVELGRERTDKIFTILVEFGDQVDSTTMFDPDGPDGPKPPAPKYGGTPGPLHNTIAEPDRKLDNSTAWRKDYSQSHFQDLYFGTGKGKNSLKTYYEKTSSGRYSVEGDVADWVKIPYNEARYGSNYCGQTNCSNVWDTVKDGVTAWAEGQKKAGKTDAQITAQLAQYDQWDRYDFDGDGNFNEPDGYIDHFQIVHAGEDESAGGGVQGHDALWAHRWYAYGTNAGKTGPEGNKAGGTQIGTSGIWVGDYTMQPENGGLGVFAHEYGHDLGLPDLYDTSGGGENSVGFWSLMSAGSWLGSGKDSIGDLPGDMTAWDKLQLGWLNYDTAKAATKSTHKLGVSAYNTKNKQALVVELPKKQVKTDVVAPAEGSSQWWSNMGDDLKNTLTRSVDLTGKSSAALSLKGWWDIEADYDFLYTEVSTDGGANWTALAGTADGAAIPVDAAGSPSLTGVSGAWKSLKFPLDAYAGKKIDLRFRYQTDGGAGGKGFTADAVTLTADGATLFTDGAENGDNGWTGKGFSRIGAGFTKEYAQYYLAENRRYVGSDTTLKVGPYNFGSAARPKWVEHYPYQDGLLIWLWDTSQKDNNTSQHPGSGLILPIDSKAKPIKWSDGTLLRNKIQPFDAPFSWYSTDALTLHKADKELWIKPSAGNGVFDDHKGKYYYDENPTGSVKVTDTNTKIKIAKESYEGLEMTVEVGPAAK
ncbi:MULTISPECIES: immune inhibitor A domain-containing protein [unclassified Streptomyces]|uniref:immune inhibitor A domain-containing protein n=1 Tax=unclassified Streptomyces TaxID=2593676 RepID=UPI0027E4A8DE|nr:MULTISPECIES: immune inhibitor A domain-containing protein [unclassified Streptomyces]